MYFSFFYLPPHWILHLLSSLIYFSEKDGSKAVPISYKDRIHLVALSKQVSFGQFKAESTVEVGLFDVVGNDRK